MIVGLKQSIAFQKSHLTDSGWPRKLYNIDNLIEIGLCVRGIVTNNHSGNVNAFSAVIKKFNSESNYYIKHSQNSHKHTYFMIVMTLFIS